MLTVTTLVNSIFIPLQQGLRLVKLPVESCNQNFIFIPLEQGLRRECLKGEMPGFIFYLHSIRTRIKTTKPRLYANPGLYSIFIPLEQGLRPQKLDGIAFVSKFYLHSIRTRIKTPMCLS